MAECNKLRHDTLQDAQDYCQVVRGRNTGTKLEKHNYRLHAYRCPHCNYFHVGHWRGPKQ
jgi:hypothetical protein